MATECEIYDIAQGNISDLTSTSRDTLILIISPVHGFNYPKITLDFINNLPRGTNPVVLMNTRGAIKIGSFVTPGLSGIAFMLSSLIIKSKGYKIVGQVPFDMPSNWLSIHPSLNEKTVKYIHGVNNSRAEKHAHKIFSGHGDFLAYRDLIQDILIAPVALGYYLIGRFALAKSFYASADCYSCGNCIEKCPVKAIKTVKEHPFWTFKCESCMKCMNNCPKRAIESAHGLFASAGILSSIVFTFIINSALQFFIKSSSIRIALWSIIFIAITWFLYRIQHLLLRRKFFLKIIPFTSLTHYKFWGRYKSIPDTKWKE